MHRLTYALFKVPIFASDTTGRAPKSKYIMGKRNWCSVKWEPSGNLVFDIRVEKQKGGGQTVGCVSCFMVFRNVHKAAILDTQSMRRHRAGLNEGIRLGSKSILHCARFVSIVRSL